MSLVIGDNFSYQGRNPLDSRMLFDTIAAMKNYSENYLPDITLAFNKEDGKMYVFNRTNDVDEDTGKWREFEGGAGVTDYDDLLNKPLEKQAVTETKYMFQRMSDMLYEVYSLELETGATLYNTETGNPTSWTLYVDGDTYKIDSASGGVLTYLGEHTEVIGTQVVVNDPYKDAFRVENLTNVKINDVKDGDVFTFRDEGQSLYAWQPLEGEPFYSEKEIPEEGDVVYDSTGGVITQLPIDSYRWTTDHQAQEGFAFIRQASNPTPYYDIQVGRYPQGDIIKEKYWTNAEASGGSIQVSELPTATAENVGKVYQYIGADTQDYKHDFFYENKHTEGTPGYYAFLIEGGAEPYYATSETPSDGDPIFVNNEGEFMQIPLGIGYWVVDAESPSGYSLYAVDDGSSMPTTRDSTQDIPGEPGGYQRVAVEVQEGNYDTLKNKPVYVGSSMQPGYGWTVEYEGQGGQTETRDFLTFVDELPENGTISAYDIEYDEWFELEMQDGLANGEDTVTRNSSIDQDITETTKEVNEKYYDIIGITEFPTPSSKYANKIYRYIGDETEVNYPNDHAVSVYNQDLVICQEINGPYYWTKYRMTTAPAELPTYWEGGYGETNNRYYSSDTSIVSYFGHLYTGTVNWSTFQWTWGELPMGTDDYNDLENKPLELEETTVNAYAFTIDAGASIGSTVYVKEITNGATLYRILNDKLEPFSENATLVINGNSYSTDSGVPMTRTPANDTETTLYSPKVNEPYTELFQNLSAGKGIKIYDEYSDFSAIQGPCENGFHIPQSSEWTALQNAITTPTQLETLLHLPFAGCLQNGGNPSYSGTNHYYWNSTVSSQAGYAEHLYSWSGSDAYYPTNNSWRKYAMPIRAFKDVPVIPDNTWNETLTNKVWEKNGLISILVDTNKYVTVKDKNEGATVVYNHGDALTDANCGKCFQRGNNYAFSLNGETVIATTVNTTGYSRENPYSSSEFHYPSGNDWSNPSNDELWGATTGVRELTDAIVNTGVLSVNGKKGDVTIAMEDITNVEITNPQDGDVLGFDSTSTKWKNVNKDYNEGPGIKIGDYIDYLLLQGPCDEGFHVPTKGDVSGFGSLLTSVVSQADKGNIPTYLHMPMGGCLKINNSGSGIGSPTELDNYMYLWASTPSEQNGQSYYWMISRVGSISNSGNNRINAFGIRPFANEVVLPDNTWTVEYGTLGSSGIFHNATLGLITITNGETTYTISDKNLGATVVYDTGDTKSADNVGCYYQWGNNNGFLFTGNSDTSTTKIDTTGYSATNPYTSSTLIVTNVPVYEAKDWSTVDNDDLWGGASSIHTNAITNIGVLSVNGKTGHVALEIQQSLPELTDVEISNVQDGDIIAYDAASSKYKNIKNDPYIAGEGISLEPTTKTVNDYSAMRGPCPEGFHIPSGLGNINSIINSISDYKKLHMPTNCGYWAGSWQNRNNPESGWTDLYWETDPGTYAGEGYAWHFDEYNSNRCGSTDASATYGLPIRAFRDEVVLPDSTWTEELAGKIWHNAALGLITYFDGTDYYTMADKNVGATQVWDDGDTCTDANVGLYFQQGNNYGYHYGDTVPTTDELIDVSSVEPSTYSSATWGSVDHSSRWDEVNADIWGEETRSQLKTITKTGIQNLSMNESNVAFATVTLTGTTATLSNAFVTAETFVDYIVKNGTPAGTITITVANGTVTVSSTATENLILLLRLEKVNSKSVILN